MNLSWKNKEQLQYTPETNNNYIKIQMVYYTHRVLFKVLMDLFSQSLLYFRVSSQEVSCKSKRYASGFIGRQQESNRICNNLSFLKSFLCLTVSSIYQQLKEVLAL